jgi:hypothetical protein
MSGLEEANKAITEVCEALKTSPAIGRAIDSFREFLLDKNQAYGNSIYEPVRVFTSASIDSLILVRLNDKATRLLKGESGGEDSFDDLLGYLILRKALPLYLESKETLERGGDETSHSWALDGLTDEERNDPGYVAHLKMVATNIDIADRERPVPSHVVTQSLRDRGLRVGMTFEEVRDNKWTECESESIERPGFCTPQEPCSACKFLDGAMCKCGHSYTLHRESENCVGCDDGCGAFSLASWTPDSDGPTYREEPPMVYKSVDANANNGLDGVAAQVADAINASDSAWVARVSHTDGSTVNLIQSHAQPKKETDMTDTNATTTTKKPRIDRKTWHESADGKHAIGSVLGFMSENPIVSWAIGKLTERSGLARADVDLAIDHLLSTGAIDQHGKAKGTRYAVAGFTDWPAPTPRNRKSNEPPVSEADADAAHSLDASDSEET